MDVSTPEGRHSFIEILVNWSLCKDSQLSRDPTMEYLPQLQCWQISCPGEASCMGKGAVVRDYYFSTVSCQADRVYSRHMRCFLATDARPTPVILTDNPLKPTVVIKDSWAFSKRNASEDTRDEVKSLNKVKDGLLEKAAELDIVIPEIVAGGRVSFLRNGKWVEDNTDTVYGLGEADGPFFRAHRRIVMSLIGEPLHSTKSVAEFVTVVCDAMRCHSAFVEFCNILQRDVSDNNILVFRQGDGIARGMLIDLDCAIDLGQGEQDKRNEMAGTDPYTSINNLSTSAVKRTSLDDWESMLYLICWFATLGTISGNRREDPELAGYAFINHESFMHSIVNHFKPEGVASSASGEIGAGGETDENDLLKNLAILLHMRLFQNRRLTLDYHGAIEKPNHVEPERRYLSFEEELDEELEADELDGLSSESLPMVDPFEERAKICDKISKQLLATTNDYWKKAMGLQKKAIEAKSNVAIDNIP
ncbi:hypothetical protein GGI19_003584 [Coemansia pectinata]|uniref:Fungal-type protein kinase domain-containing protein n=1 Tax=Coemansia pectinata TaxID=1052879 RepID=A0A9W8GU13_9FUNG|nr:hypothetical protein GGI19_003584 [Coemansia pectinata]